ncbi:right-handed parallel beta-helix repeat-containing protein [Bradyrhizobium ontarionense]|uniref:Right-handed parallel beta-helix repeat-containing protein n=1 Tax=Bradyrhizobium ontarionense TaxID=2898149 RepID=A0ABY3RCH4_9BRAD|nr:right-handed parallel beta-helix repeat-containing protein [Bradyrhizobium sp. A19]UFZ04787.1 right-handed parallel beta-helix repeat-containing protein [Bradyrhizobium sp. A19]
MASASRAFSAGKGRLGAPPSGPGWVRACGERIRTFCAAGLALLIAHGPVNGGAGAADTQPSPPRASLLPADRMTAWTPGLMSAGGIPIRTTIYRTLSPGGGDDAGAIQAALNSAPAGQVVMLSPGTFIVNEPVLINRSITLRGSGAGTTRLVKPNGARARTSAVIAGTRGIQAPVDPGSYGHDPKPVIIVGPSRWNNGPDSTASQNLLADGAQGTTTVTVANAAAFKAGDFVLLDEASGASWQPTPAGFPGGARVWQGDRVAWNMHDPVQPGDDNGASDVGGPYDDKPGVLPKSMSWFGRTDRATAEIKEIASIAASTVTFTSPLTIGYRASHQAQLTPYSTDPNSGGHAGNKLDIHVAKAGVEDLSIIGGADGALRFETATYSWAKAVEVTQWLGEGVAIDNSFRVELRDSYIHAGSWPQPGGAGYAISLAAGSSDVLIENNILVDVCKNMVFRSSGAGSVVAYNYADDSFDFDNPGWVEVGINASHMAGSHHVLFEGNLSHNADSDYTHGNAIYLTFFRNHLTGQRQRFVDRAGLRAVGLAYGSWWDSFVGNVLGRPGRMSGWNYDDPSMGMNAAMWGNGGVGNVWMLGYDPERWTMTPDRKTLETVIRGGNFDYLTNKLVWTERLQAQPLPASLYLTAKPGFFGHYQWPWVDPAGDTKLHMLPAKARLDAGTPFAAAPGATQ